MNEIDIHCDMCQCQAKAPACFNDDGNLEYGSSQQMPFQVGKHPCEVLRIRLAFPSKMKLCHDCRAKLLAQFFYIQTKQVADAISESLYEHITPLPLPDKKEQQ